MSTAEPPSISLIYVPSDVGSIIPGKSKAPAAFRKVNIVSKLNDAGYTSVYEHHALPLPATYSAGSISSSGVRNEVANIAVCEAVRDTVTRSLNDGADRKSDDEMKPPFQLILGGECCMLPAVLSAFWRHYARISPIKPSPSPKRVGLIYVDADTDLSLPAISPSSSGTFASMNMTHLTFCSPHSLPAMRQFSRPDESPVCDSSNTVLFGTNMRLQSNTRDHFAYLFDNNYKVVSSTSIAQNPKQRAEEALNYLEERVDVIFVHLDVDSIDPGLFPLANVPNFTGVGFGEMMRALGVFMESDKVQGLCIAEVNPDHDPTLRMVERLTGTVANMLALRIKR